MIINPILCFFSSDRVSDATFSSWSVLGLSPVITMQNKKFHLLGNGKNHLKRFFSVGSLKYFKKFNKEIFEISEKI